MTSWKTVKGRIGVTRVILKLAELGLDSIPTPNHWRFDLLTENGLKLEIKFANIGEAISGTGYKFNRFTFKLNKFELEIFDFLILVFNTEKGFLYYIIPQKAVTSLTIAFNPFSKQESRYSIYKEQWDLLLKYKKEDLKDMEKEELKVLREKQNVQKKHL